MSRPIPQSLNINKKLLDDINASESFNLKVPEDAKQTGAGDNVRYTWVELVQITESSVQWAENNEDVLVFKVGFRIPDDTPYPTNVGRVFSSFYRVNVRSMETLGQGDEAMQRQYRMTTMALSKLRGIARACGFDVPESDLPTAYFAPMDGEKPEVLGHRMYMRMRDKLGKDADGNPARQQEPTKFVPESEGVEA